MKITIEELLSRQKSLDKVLSTDLPFKLSYRLTKIAVAIIAESKHIQKTRNDIIKRIGEKQDNGGHKLVLEKQKSLFAEEWNKFAEEEIDLKIDKIPYECLEKGFNKDEEKSVKLSAYDLADLAIFIADPEKEPKKPKKK